MGRVVAIAVAVVASWGSLAQIWPEAFQVSRNPRLKEFLWGPKSIWVAFLACGLAVGSYVWTLEDRFASLQSNTVSSESNIDETGLRFVSWGPLPDGSGCTAAIDTSGLPPKFRKKYEIALICGFSTPRRIG